MTSSGTPSDTPTCTCTSYYSSTAPRGKSTFSGRWRLFICSIFNHIPHLLFQVTARCWIPVVVYKVTCKISGCQYIGATKRFLKTRMVDHLTDVGRLFRTGKKSDTFAKFFVKFHQAVGILRLTPAIQRERLKVEILWQGNPISSVKTFATRHCTLCSREKLEILKHFRATPHLLINSKHEILGACRHKPAFHSYTKNTIPSAEDPIEAIGERVPALY